MSYEPDQPRHPELGLVAGIVPAQADVTQTDANLGGSKAGRNDRLVREGAITLRPSEGIAQGRCGSHDIVDQTDFADLKIEAEVKAENIVPQRLGQKVKQHG